MLPSLAPSWQTVLKEEFDKDYLKSLLSFLEEEKQNGITVYPKSTDIFNALNMTPFDKIKVVILGQDPYHGANQAHGLSFSVQHGVAVPPSLKNIYKELETDIVGFKKPGHGNLSHWAEQGILLLNATLTVRASSPGSHQKRGWEIFTDEIIKTISAQRENVVFLLWGKFAQQKATLIDHQKHNVLIAAHPSPFSAYAGFFGSKHFSKTNELLIQHGIEPIDWRL